jgi:hypothetical protein
MFSFDLGIRQLFQSELKEKGPENFFSRPFPTSSY